MLYGFAIECLAKGVLLRQDPTIARSGQLPDWPSKPHDVTALCRKTGLVLQAVEKDALDRLGEFVRWRGRYPIPSSFEQLKPRSAVAGGGTPFITGRDREIVDDLYERLDAMLRGK
jgi:hypothetical protein